MSEIMDDFDAGKKFAQNKVLELMDEVIEQYEGQYDNAEQENDIGSAEHSQAQINAVKFMKSWVVSGGHEDEYGNRVCLVW
jgi:hypothetical protein|tara:strand:+ start:2643 stop:2885 length:243 start_codon:yes stop_codon:yes gene_type:complete